MKLGVMSDDFRSVVVMITVSDEVKLLTLDSEVTRL